MCFSACYFEFLELKVVYVVIKIKRYRTEAECIYDYLVFFIWNRDKMFNVISELID